MVQVDVEVVQVGCENLQRIRISDTKRCCLFLNYALILLKKKLLAGRELTSELEVLNLIESLSC